MKKTKSSPRSSGKKSKSKNPEEWRLIQNPQSPKSPPPRIPGFHHSKQVLVYYEGNPESNTVSKFAVAFYHYDPPFDNGPRWVDWTNIGRQPALWWHLPFVLNLPAPKTKPEPF